MSGSLPSPAPLDAYKLETGLGRADRSGSERVTLQTICSKSRCNDGTCISGKNAGSSTRKLVHLAVVAVDF